MNAESEAVEEVVVAKQNPAYQVTPLSKYLALLLFIILPFLGAWIGYEYAPERVVEVEKIVIKNVVAINPSNSEEISTVDVENLYLESEYRVVSVSTNPFYDTDESRYDRLVIAAARGANDYICGGMYVPFNCYMFLESSYADVSTPKFVGVWNQGAITPDTIAFISPTEITFETTFGDAGYRYEAVWQLDLETGSSTRIAFEEFQIEENL